MKIHFFMDPFGHYASLFADRLMELNATDHRVVNINASKITHPAIQSISATKSGLKKWLREQGNIEQAYFHYYNPVFQWLNDYLKKSHPGLRSAWILWGGDFYALPEFKTKSYLPFSKQAVLARRINRSNPFRRFVTQIVYRLKGLMPYDYTQFLSSVQRIDYIATTFERDYLNAIQLSGSAARFIPFSYAALEHLLGDLFHAGQMEPGSKIMVGHSADPVLNHYEVLSSLNAMKISRPVILPLLYGDAAYKQKLLQAVDGFDLDLEIVATYLPMEAYNKKMSEVGFAVFNVPHQMAFGNIVVLVWLGAKVFLHHESSIFTSFKQAGIRLADVRDLSADDAFVPLRQDEVAQNRQLLASLFSTGKVTEMYHQMLQLHNA